MRQARTTKQTHTHTDNQSVSYSEALVESLIAYANQNTEFASTLAKLTKSIQTHSIEPLPTFNKPIEILLPDNETDAKTRAKWLINHLKNHTLPNSNQAASRLQTFAHRRTSTSPKQIVVGIAAGIIPGITLGRISKLYEMTVIIRDDIATNPTIQLSRWVNQATLNIFTKSLQTHDGQLNQIEPEIAKWATEDKAMTYFTANQNEMLRIAQELQSFEIPHHLITNEGLPTVLAISPVVNQLFSRLHWDIESLNT